MLKANDPLLPGIDFVIGGTTYTAPPLTLGGIKAITPRLSGLDAEVMSAVLCVSLKRNYPDVTQPWLDETMVGEEFRANKPLMMALLRSSGLIDPKAAEPGEATAAA